MANNGIVTQYDDAGFPVSARSTQGVSASGGIVTLKQGPGRFAKAVVTTATTTTAVTVYDNASTNSGTPLLVIPAAAAAGTIYAVDLPFVNGLTVNGAAAAGAITFGWS